MNCKSLIWVSLAAVFLPTISLAHSRSKLEPSLAVVSTHRSDGTIFPAKRQTRRLQKHQHVNVSSSVQALPTRTWRAAVHEPAMGGDFVAPASHGPDNHLFVIPDPYLHVRFDRSNTESKRKLRP